MIVLYLGPNRPHITRFIQSHGDTVIHAEDKVSADDPRVRNADLIVSYGYRHILQPDLLRLFNQRAINLHISYLPWNKGADPNLWSFLEDTPKGVTIHLLAPEVDAGDIIAQREVEMSNTDTLRISYDKLSQTIEELFMEVWPSIRTGEFTTTTQPTGGSSHKLKDKRKYEDLLYAGYDTIVRDLTGKALVESEV